MEETDVRLVIRKLLSKWYWFALSLFITLSLAAIYLKVTDKLYLVETTIQLKDQSLGNKGTAQQKFISGFELLATDSELEDEIGVLTSYSTIKESLANGEFEVRYYQYPNLAGAAGKFFAKRLSQLLARFGQETALFETAHRRRVEQLVQLDLGYFGVNPGDNFLNDFPRRVIRHHVQGGHDV